MKNGVAPEKKRWFITDRAIEKPEDDAFGHRDVAAQLADIVRSIEAPATVGLLGGFGTGKSSIGNLLAAQLKGDSSYQVVTLSAEKHSETARQRALVFSFAEALEQDAGVDPKRVQAELARVETGEDRQGPDLGPPPIWHYLKEHVGELKQAGLLALALFVSCYVLGVLVALGLSAANVIENNPFSWPLTTAYLGVPVVAGLFAAATSTFGSWSKAALTPGTLTKRRPRAEAADELERIFSNLAKLVPQQLVIVVDDIDRLAPREVLDALSTIKTLQAVPRDHPPLFIVSCDDSIVRQALEDARPAPRSGDPAARVSAEEYLNKLFVVRQPLPPHLKDDMQDFSRRLLTSSQHAGADALGPQLDPVLEILIHEGVDDPRHVIRLLNAFFADYRLALARESGNARLSDGEVTKYPLNLARLTVLRVDFPELHDAVRDDFDLLEAMDRHVLNEELDESHRRLLHASTLALQVERSEASTESSASTEPSSTSGEAADREVELPHDLADFLRRTIPYVVRDLPLAPFFYMGQTSAGRILGSQRADRIRRALENNDVDHVEEALRDEESVAQAAVAHIRAILQSVPPGLRRNNAVATAATALVATPEASRSELADALAALIGREASAVPRPPGLANILRYAAPGFGSNLRGLLVEFEEDPASNEERAISILDLAAEQPTEPVLRKALDYYFTTLVEGVGWSGVQPWLERAQAIEPGTRNQLLGPAFFAAILCGAVGTAHDDITEDDVVLTTALLNDAGAPVTENADVGEALLTCGRAAGTEPRWFALRTLESLDPPTGATSDILTMASTAVTDPDVTPHSEIRRLAMVMMDRWATERAGQIESLPADAIDVVVGSLAAVLGDGEENETKAAASALRTIGRIWPDAIEIAVTAAVGSLAAHRDLNDAKGCDLQQALIDLISTAKPEVLSEIDSGLFDVIDDATNESDPAVQMALEAVPLVARIAEGKPLVEARSATWRNEYATSHPDAASYRPALLALRSAAAEGALPDSTEEALFQRLVALTAQGGHLSAAAATAFATIPWQPGRRVGATEHLSTCWSALEASDRTDAMVRVAAWAPEPGEIHSDFSEIATSFALAEPDGQAASLLRMWHALTASDRSRAVAEGLQSLPGVSARVPMLDGDELLDALRRVHEPSVFADLIAATSGAAQVVLDDAAGRYLEESLNDTGIRWNHDRAHSAVTVISSPRAHELANAAAPRLRNGAVEAERTAALITMLRDVDADAVSDVSDAIVESVDTLLRGATPELATRLGEAASHLDRQLFKEPLKGARGDREDHVGRAAADAFEAAHNPAR